MNKKLVELHNSIVRLDEHVRKMDSYKECPSCRGLFHQGRMITVGQCWSDNYGGLIESEAHGGYKESVQLCVHCAQYQDVVFRYAPIADERPKHLPELHISDKANEMRYLDRP